MALEHKFNRFRAYVRNTSLRPWNATLEMRKEFFGEYELRLEFESKKFDGKKFDEFLVVAYMQGEEMRVERYYDRDVPGRMDNPKLVNGAMDYCHPIFEELLTHEVNVCMESLLRSANEPFSKEVLKEYQTRILSARMGEIKDYVEQCLTDQINRINPVPVPGCEWKGNIQAISPIASRISFIRKVEPDGVSSLLIAGVLWGEGQFKIIEQIYNESEGYCDVSPTVWMKYFAALSKDPIRSQMRYAVQKYDNCLIEFYNLIKKEL
ncbi:hypothetical protein [uncultured Parabacteroides sp.]|uniref:hypothetical protein n=1 Tax=uncultured Parabacteroides sp. TaxID=512312 RepID=UPI0025CBCCC0|nr:hypothetical protein [uncultured Parabacteroides sp.]